LKYRTNAKRNTTVRFHRLTNWPVTGGFGPKWLSCLSQVSMKSIRVPAF
jgi:hypothetical protein